MDNQHKKIKGYRDLSQSEIDLVNEAKELAVKVGELCDKIYMNVDSDKKWAIVGKTDLQKGFMCIIRAIAKPETF